MCVCVVGVCVCVSERERERERERLALCAYDCMVCQNHVTKRAFHKPGKPHVENKAHVVMNKEDKVSSSLLR